MSFINVVLIFLERTNVVVRGYLCLRACSMIWVLIDFFHQGKQCSLPFSWVLSCLPSSPSHIRVCGLWLTLVGYNTCLWGSEKSELTIYPLGQIISRLISIGLVLWAVFICGIVACVVWCHALFHCLGRCLADRCCWHPFYFAGWKSNQKPQESHQWTALSLENSLPRAWVFRRGQYWIKLAYIWHFSA